MAKDIEVALGQEMSYIILELRLLTEIDSTGANIYLNSSPISPGEKSVCSSRREVALPEVSLFAGFLSEDIRTITTYMKRLRTANAHYPSA